MITLRPYQIEASRSTREAWANGIQSQLIVMTMGMGKTETFLSILADELGEGLLSRAIVIAHRKELIDQPAQRIARHWTHLLPEPGIVMAERNDVDARLICATIQTLGTPGRLDTILAHGPISHVVIDEAHHATASSYLSVIDKLKTANPDLRILGVTATPKRTDGDGLRRVFERVAFKATIKEGISKYKALSPFVALGVQLPVDISQIEMRGDDYDPEQLGTVLDADNVLELVFETWHKHAGDRPTMVFTASVAQARHLAQFFQSRDVATAWASGETPKPERAQIIGDFLDGKLQVIVNCALWTEGFDAPRTACVAMVRPTRSDTVYLQAVGRGLRLAEGKTDCLILDFVPLGGRDLIMAGDLLGKPKAQAKREAKAKTEGTVIEAFGITADGVGIDGDPDDVIVKALDLFAQAPVQWTFDGQVSTAGVGNDLTVAIVSPQPRRIEQAAAMRSAGEWRPDWDTLLARLNSYQVYAINGICIPLGTAATWDDALILAGEYIDEHGDPTLARRTSSWRHNPPSEKQAAFAARLGVLRSGMSRGQVAQAITHALALRALRNAKVVR